VKKRKGRDLQTRSAEAPILCNVELKTGRERKLLLFSCVYILFCENDFSYSGVDEGNDVLLFGFSLADYS